MAVMVDDKVQAIKRFIRTYSVAVAATVILIIILAILIIARYNALSSIRDLSKLNPLITSEQNELVAGKDSSGVIEVAKVDNTKKDDKKDIAKNNNTKSSGTGSSSGGSNGGSSSGGSSGGGSSGGGSEGGGEGDEDNGGSGQQEPFFASISETFYYSPGTGIPNIISGKCKLTHAFYAKILGVNSPGVVTYKWQHSKGGQPSSEQMTFQEGDSLKTTPSHEWEINAKAGQYSVIFKLLTPVYEETQPINFVHKCLGESSR